MDIVASAVRLCGSIVFGAFLLVGLHSVSFLVVIASIYVLKTSAQLLTFMLSYLAAMIAVANGIVGFSFVFGVETAFEIINTVSSK